MCVIFVFYSVMYLIASSSLHAHFYLHVIVRFILATFWLAALCIKAKYNCINRLVNYLSHI
jgi:hypothetical protein